MSDRRTGIGWAWEIEHADGWHICNWAEPYKDWLLPGDMPSAGARVVRVELVPTSKSNRKRYGIE